MQKRFVELRERLLREGVARRHVQRYLRELEEHLSDLRTEEERAGRCAAEAEMAALRRLGTTDELAGAMLAKPQLRAWSVRAPWVVFGAGSVVCVAALYAIACLILWSGWRLFLPGAETPFVPVDGLAIFYFGVGRMIYWSAPVLVGWGLGMVTARQRLSAVWPAVGLVLVALAGATAQVHAMAPSTAGAWGHVSLGLRVGATPEENLGRLAHACAVFGWAAFPYTLWRVLRARAA